MILEAEATQLKSAQMLAPSSAAAAAHEATEGAREATHSRQRASRVRSQSEIGEVSTYSPSCSLVSRGRLEQQALRAREWG